MAEQLAVLREQVALLPERAQVNGVHDCHAPLCECECGAQVTALGKPLRHQVFDISPAAFDVQEYRLYSGVCKGCGKPHRAVLPSGVPTGQTGPRALALVGVLATRYHHTQFKIRNLLAELAGLDFSVGAISHAHGKVSAAMKAPVAELAKALRKAPVVPQPKLAVFSIPAIAGALRH